MTLHQRGRAVAERIWRAALDAVRPERILPAWIQREADSVQIAGVPWSRSCGGRLRVLAIGKASDAMARAAAQLAGDLVHDGLIVTKSGHADRSSSSHFEVVEASHPVPDSRSLAAAARVRSFLAGGRRSDLVLLLLSGGASALVADPRPGISLEDLATVSRDLMRAGATIHELNTVRKHLEHLKGGGLLRCSAPARVVALLYSDVVGDAPSTIGGGLAAPDPTTFADAICVLEKRGLWAATPASVRSVLERGRRGEEPETLKPGDPISASALCQIVASSTNAVEAAATTAAVEGFLPAILTTELEGEAREAARSIAAIVREVAIRGRPWKPPVALIAAGETTVTVRGDGRGGRNQEAALAAALALDGLSRVIWTSIGTDGSDGPTDAAGATVDGTTAEIARHCGVDLSDALRRNDAYSALDRLGCLVRTGPTGTHVNDLWFALVP